MECAPRSLCAYSAERIFIISRLSRSAERSKRIFTGGVVTENGICSAAFCESVALRLASSPSQSPTVTALPRGEPLAVHANFISLPRPLPLGEVDLRSKDGEGEDDCEEDTPSVCSLRSQPAPPRGRLWAVPKTLLPPPKAVPLRDDFPRSGGRCRIATKGGVWLDAKRQDGRGTSPKIFPPLQ